MYVENLFPEFRPCQCIHWQGRECLRATLRVLHPPHMFKLFKKTKKEPKNIAEILEYLERLDRKIEALSEKLEEFKKKSKIHFQKIGMVRFNPFKEVGGDQSFSIALLDAGNNGFVITSLYGKEENRVYAKPIKNGTSEYILSEEEKKAIEKATKS